MEQILKNSNKNVWLGVSVAALLWMVMFSPWTGPHLNFWYAMSFSAAILITISTIFCSEWIKDIHANPKALALGLLIAALLWGVFWLGDIISQWLFGFARMQVDLIYDMKEDTSPTLIALLLLLLIGPAEEIFWRGFIQRRFTQRWGADIGFLLTTAIYAAVHIWSLNFMLIMAALVAGFCWGIIYRIWPQTLGSLIISHALWDACAFVIFPFHS